MKTVTCSGSHREAANPPTAAETQVSNSASSLFLRNVITPLCAEGSGGVGTRGHPHCSHISVHYTCVSFIPVTPILQVRLSDCHPRVVTYLCPWKGPGCVRSGFRRPARTGAVGTLAHASLFPWSCFSSLPSLLRPGSGSCHTWCPALLRIQGLPGGEGSKCQLHLLERRGRKYLPWPLLAQAGPRAPACSPLGAFSTLPLSCSSGAPPLGGHPRSLCQRPCGRGVGLLDKTQHAQFHLNFR